jgi:hypothetical protein
MIFLGFPSINIPKMDLPSVEDLKFRLESVLGFPKISKTKFKSLSNSFSNLPALNTFGSHETLYSKFKQRRGSDATISNVSTIITPVDVTEEVKPYNLVLDYSSNIDIAFSDHPLLTISRISQVYQDMSEKKDLNCKERNHIRKLKASASKSLQLVESQISVLNSKRLALLSRLDDICIKETIVVENITLLEERMEYWENQICMFEGKLLSTDSCNQDFNVEMVIYSVYFRKSRLIIIRLNM